MRLALTALTALGFSGCVTVAEPEAVEPIGRLDNCQTINGLLECDAIPLDENGNPVEPIRDEPVLLMV